MAGKEKFPLSEVRKDFNINPPGRPDRASGGHEIEGTPTVDYTANDSNHRHDAVHDTSNNVTHSGSMLCQPSGEDSVADLGAVGFTRIQEQQAQDIKIQERAPENLSKHYETEPQKKDARISDLEERNKHYETELQKKDARISDLEKLTKHYETKLQEMTTKLKQVTAEEGCENTKKEEYELGEVLGTTFGQSGLVNIRAVKYPSGEERARKSVECKVLRVSEIAAMLDVQGSLYFPRLYQVDIFMEKIEGKTVHGLIQNMKDLRQHRPELVFPVALSIFYDVLSAISLLRNKNWIHGDIHGGNVMVTADSLQGKVLDFGRALRPKGPGVQEYREDVIKSIRLLFSLMIVDFDTWDPVEKRGHRDPETRKKMKDNMAGTPDEQEQVLKIIEMTEDAVECTKQGQCGDLQPVINTIDRMKPARQREKARKEAAIFWFPESHAHDHSTGADGATPDQGTGMDWDKEMDNEGLHIDERNDDFDSERDRGDRAGDYNISTPSGKSSLLDWINKFFK